MPNFKKLWLNELLKSELLVLLPLGLLMALNWRVRGEFVFEIFLTTWLLLQVVIAIRLLLVYWRFKAQA